MWVDFDKILSAIAAKFKMSPFSIPITLIGFSRGALTDVVILLLDDVYKVCC